MEKNSSNGWKFFAILFGALLAAVVGLYVYKQQNPDYDPWEEPWENSSSPWTSDSIRPRTTRLRRMRPARPQPQRKPPDSSSPVDRQSRIMPVRDFLCARHVPPITIRRRVDVRKLIH